MNYNYYFKYKNGQLIWVNPTTPKHKHYVGKAAGTYDKDGYLHIGLKGKKMPIHRAIWEMFNGTIPKGLQVDHINGTKDDNRIENLQLVTQKQNQQRRSNSKGYTKVGEQYKSAKRFNCKTYYLGMFKTPCGAYMANRIFHVNRGRI